MFSEESKDSLPNWSIREYIGKGAGSTREKVLPYFLVNSGAFCVSRIKNTMISHPEMTQPDLLQQVVKTLTSLGSPERRIDQALALLGHEPFLSLKPLKGSKTQKIMPVLIGKSPVMEVLHAAIQRIASTPATVLIRGESGTGKELVARSLHVSSTFGQKKTPFPKTRWGRTPIVPKSTL